MTRTEQIIKGAVAITVIALSLWAGFRAASGLSCLTQHIIIAVDHWGDAGRNASATMENINAASRQQIASATAIERDVRIEMWKLDRVLGSTDATIKSLVPLAQSAQGAIGSIQTTLGVIDDQAKHVGPLLDSVKAATDSVPPAVRSVQSVADQTTVDLATLNRRMTDPTVDQFMQNVVHMSYTADAVETKAADGYLHPSKNPWARAWKETSPFVILGAKVGASLF